MVKIDFEDRLDAQPLGPFVNMEYLSSAPIDEVTPAASSSISGTRRHHHHHHCRRRRTW